MEEKNTKTCSRCKKELEATEEFFTKEKAAKLGLSNWCIKCRKQYRTENRERDKAYAKIYSEKNIGILREKKKEYYKKNKTRIDERNRKYYEKNKNNPILMQRKKETTRIYKELHREEMVIYSQKYKSEKLKLKCTLTLEEWRETKNFFNNKCAYCGKEKKLTQEHVVPKSKGGNYKKHNIIPSCQYCNSSKGAKDFEKWYPAYKFYSKERENKILEFIGGLNYE